MFPKQNTFILDQTGCQTHRHVGTSNTVAIADLDNDGLLEMAWIDFQANLYVWDLPSPASANSPWPMFHHYAQHTGANPLASGPIGPPVQVNVQSNPSGQAISVDEVVYSSPQTFSWAAGSHHTISAVSPQNGGTGTQYVWSSWSDGLGNSHTVSPGSATTYTANFTKQYQLTMNTGTGGQVSPASGFFDSGQVVQVSATPNSGYQFAGWTGSGVGSFTGASNSASVTMTEPIVETASFTQNQALFSAAAYNTNESIGFATITVNRLGDLSGTATVDFATSDGTAKQSKDYTIASGTLNFGSGEANKSFTVLVVDNAYLDGSRTLNVTLTNPSNMVLNGPISATLTIDDNDILPPLSNPIDDSNARFFVRQHYYDFLGRLPDQSGFDFWVNQITQCGTDQACIRRKRNDVSNAFFFELEYQQTAAYVFRLYRAAFGNNQPFENPDNSNPDEAKKIPSYAAFSLDRARLIGGSNLAQDQLALANHFVSRTEFQNKYPVALSIDRFVDAILATIKNDDGVDLTSQRATLIALGDRGSVIYRLSDDDIKSNPINNRGFIDAEYNRTFVASQYFGYLRRDADIGGFLFWLGQVGNAPLRDIAKQHAMVCSFITSAEYQLRFSPVVIHGNGECPQ